MFVFRSIGVVIDAYNQHSWTFWTICIWVKRMESKRLWQQVSSDIYANGKYDRFETCLWFFKCVIMWWLIIRRTTASFAFKIFSFLCTCIYISLSTSVCIFYSLMNNKYILTIETINFDWSFIQTKKNIYRDAYYTDQSLYTFFNSVSHRIFNWHLSTITSSSKEH